MQVSRGEGMRYGPASPRVSRGLRSTAPDAFGHAGEHRARSPRGSGSTATTSCWLRRSSRCSASPWSRRADLPPAGGQAHAAASAADRRRAVAGDLRPRAACRRAVRPDDPGRADGGGQPTTFPVQPLVPGASVSASYSSGDVCDRSPRSAPSRTSTGRPCTRSGAALDGAGQPPVLLQDAYVFCVVNNPDPSVAPQLQAGRARPAPWARYPSNTPQCRDRGGGSAAADDSRRRDRRRPRHGPVALARVSQVGRRADIGLPLGTYLLDTIAPLEVAQAATPDLRRAARRRVGEHGACAIYCAGAAKPLGLLQPVRGHRHARRRGRHAPELANAASADVTTAFGDLEQVDFAALHVTHVVADLHASRGLGNGVHRRRARCRLAVRAGRSVKVRLEVRIYRCPRRTVSFPLRIPRGASGPIVVTLHRPLRAGAGNLGQPIFGAHRVPVPRRWVLGERQRRLADLLAGRATRGDRGDPQLRRAVREPAQGMASAACSATRRC